MPFLAVQSVNKTTINRDKIVKIEEKSRYCIILMKSYKNFIDKAKSLFYIANWEKTL